jgi:hypothetical protein
MSLSGIAFVMKRRRRDQMREAANLEKPEACSLEYVEDCPWSRTAQMVTDGSPQ